MSKPPLKRCAIYTRKSHEEGLEQEFNSLDAQRESSAAYIASQKHEGWQIIKTEYNDGGFSGGNINRPALKQLLADIEAEKIDVIVVYKVDRLSRSLHDFAKMVGLFDKHNVSFVSVTQQFNTTTSMGRLTLNVLLSFAQFEREVTGERIRDKIAASKKKGIWMGGPVPLGYDAADRKLIINSSEAETVRYMFRRYLELGCVRLPAHEIEQLVMQSANTILADHSAIASAYQGADIENHELPHLLKAAEEIGQRISNDTEIFSKFITHVELRRGSLLLTLALNALLPKSSISSPITITHELPMQMKRCGVEMRMVIEVNGNPAARIDESLIKAIIRAHRWFGELALGKTASISAIATREGIDKGYVSYLLNLAFLAPDITEAIIAGKQPADLSVNGLTKRIQLPVEWSQQRRTLGFAQPQR